MDNPIVAKVQELVNDIKIKEKNLKNNYVEKSIDNFVKYYNIDRLKVKIIELSPIQFRKLTLNNVFF